MSKYKTGQLLRCTQNWQTNVEKGWTALISHRWGDNSEGHVVWQIVFFPPRKLTSEFYRWSEGNLDKHWEIVEQPE